MSKSRLGIIDGQWVCRRNHMMLQNNEDFSEGRLWTVTLQSISKWIKEFNLQRVIILWDKAPYYRQEHFSYKQDRTYATEADIKEPTPEMTDEERKALEQQNADIREKIRREKIMQNVKYSFINKMGKFGFISLIKDHYEADDLAYYIVNKLNLSMEPVFITKDSDWYYLMGPGTEFIRIMKDPVIVKYEDLISTPDRQELLKIYPLHILGILKDLFQGSHNGTGKVTTKYKMDFKEFVRKIHEGNLDEFLDEENKKQVEEFMLHTNPDKYWNDHIAKMITERINQPINHTDAYTWDMFCMDNGINVKYNYYKAVLDKFEKNSTPVVTEKVIPIESLSLVDDILEG